ncbi:MAG TPA: c-type cytochrome [Caldimonas sp.]|jgi:cytochrome c5|nr:c-type cytochrome [Caldimonas sp.]HEX2540645.1 c-type cytochrome [Caldimonas sp.]
MTEAHDPNDIDGPHEGPIKTPRQLILAILYAFVVPIFAIVLLVMFVTTEKRPAAGSDALSPQSVAQRLRPVGMVEVKDVSDPASLSSGQQVFAAQCSACHTSGALGSPKIGDAGAWAPRIKEGFAHLLQAALNGKGQMPPQKGGDFTDFEIARAVVYLTNESGAKFPAPPPPAAATAQAGNAQGGNAAAGNAQGGNAAAAGTPVPAPNAAAAAATANMAPRADANTGVPDRNAGAALNAQVRQAAPEQNPGGAAGGPSVQVAAAPAAPPLYAQACFVCHGAGVAGAPKLGDKAAWAPRLPQGLDGLTASVIKGKGAMPPRGGSTANDADIRATVTYMVNTVK